MMYVQLLAAGLAAGFLAGLLGIGGGFVVVPVLILLLPQFGVSHDIVPQVAVASSLAAMVPTAISASVTQYRRGFLDMAVLLRIAPGAALGAFIASQFARGIHGTWITLFFACYAGYFALRMLRDPLPGTQRRGLLSRAIGALPVPAVGTAIGALSAIAGIGGASMTTPYLLSTGVDMRRCVALSSGTGLAIAVAGSSGFAAGAPVAADAPLLGLICWPAAATLAVSAMLMAPHGVAASHRLPVRTMKRAFGGVLVVVCATTLLKTVGPLRYPEAAGVQAMRYTSASIVRAHQPGP